MAEIKTHLAAGAFSALSLLYIVPAMAQETLETIALPAVDISKETQTTFDSGAMLDKSVVVLQSLDKVTARTHKFEVPVGETVKFGTIYILAQACKKAPPIEQPESAAFLQIWQKKAVSDDNKKPAQPEAVIANPSASSEWIFSGWMFASSPALSAMDHPIYDVWVLDCIDKDAVQQPTKNVPTSEEADTSNKTSEQ